MVVGIGFLFVFYFLFHIYKAYHLVYENCHPKRVSISILEGIPYNMKKFSFESEGITLSAIEWLPNQDIKGTVIACHYLGGSKNAIYPYIEPLLKVGFRVVAFDYPNHGESMDRRSLRYNLEKDMQRFIYKIKEMGICGPYAIYGLSMGASLAFSAATLCNEVKVIVVDSGPLIYVSEYVSYVLRNKKVKNPIEKVAFLIFYFYVVGFRKMSKKLYQRIKNYFELPILIIHGKKDHTISIRNTEFLYCHLDTAKSNRIVVEGAHHLTNRVLMGEKYDEMIVDFIEKNLLEKSI